MCVSGVLFKNSLKKLLKKLYYEFYGVNVTKIGIKNIIIEGLYIIRVIAGISARRSFVAGALCIEWDQRHVIGHQSITKSQLFEERSFVCLDVLNNFACFFKGKWKPILEFTEISFLSII